MTELSKKSVEILLDLVEIKLGLLQIQDRDDAREVAVIHHCREELLAMMSSKNKKTARSKSASK